MARVSVLIPTYNRAPCIVGAVGSALAQTYKDLQVIIYNDGSDENDGCIEKRGDLIRVCENTETVLAKHLKDSRIKYVKNTVNQGIAKTRNTLLKLADTEYACWLDSDDRSNIYRVEILVDAMDTFKPAYVRTASTTFANGSDQTWTFPPQLLWRGGPCVASIMFRPKGAPGYDERFSVCCEDMDWECHLSAVVGRGMNVPFSLYHIGRRSPGRLSMKYKEDDYKKESIRCKDLFIHTSNLWADKIKAKGDTKKPVSAPWTLVSKYIERWYGKYHG